MLGYNPHIGFGLKNASYIKRETFYALEDVRKGNMLAKIVGCSLFALIVLNAVIVFVSVEPDFSDKFLRILAVFYRVSTVCFAIEYIARVWIADLAFAHMSRAKARMKYIFSPLGIIDFLSFFPNLIAWFVPMTPAIRNIVNIIRLVRLVKISRYMSGLMTIGRVVQKRKHEIIASFLVIALLTVVASVVMYEIENPAQPDKFNNLLSGVYWAVTTITATGYGDLVPITPLGRIVGSIIMFLSVALVAIPAGIFSAGFVSEFQRSTVRQIERDVKAESGEGASSESKRSEATKESDKKSNKESDKESGKKSNKELDKELDKESNKESDKELDEKRNKSK